MDATSATIVASWQAQFKTTDADRNKLITTSIYQLQLNRSTVAPKKVCARLPTPLVVWVHQIYTAVGVSCSATMAMVFARLSVLFVQSCNWYGACQCGTKSNAVNLILRLFPYHFLHMMSL
jgi:hypothetical protein